VGALPGAFKSTARAAGVRRDAAAADCSPAADGSTICLTYTPVIAIAPGWPPVAHDDTATTRRGTAVKIPVLGNDETHGAPATLAVADPGHGSAAVDSGRVRYIPAPGFTGRDTFRYTLTTANGSSTATVSVEVTAPPQAQDDAATTAAGHAVTIDVLANDVRGTGGALTITTVGAPAHGSATVAGGQVNYEPADGWSGTDRFTYSVRDQDGGRSRATVVVRVTAPAAPASPSAPAAPDGSGTDALSDTGFGAAAGGGAGLAAVALGVVLTACGRRRRGRRA
jgi:hypothetical protein